MVSAWRRSFPCSQGKGPGLAKPTLPTPRPRGVDAPDLRPTQYCCGAGSRSGQSKCCLQAAVIGSEMSTWPRPAGSSPRSLGAAGEGGGFALNLREWAVDPATARSFPPRGKLPDGGGRRGMGSGGMGGHCLVTHSRILDQAGPEVRDPAASGLADSRPM